MTSDYSGPPPTEPPVPYGYPTPLYPPPEAFPPPDPSVWSQPAAQINPPRSRRRAWLFTGAGAAVVIALILVSSAFVGHHSSGRASDDTVVSADPCAPETPPSSASPAAVAYLAAVNAETSVEVAISDRISTSGFVTSIDLTEQISSDRSFMGAVRAIPFTSAVQPSVTQLLDAITAYDNFLNLAASSAGYYNAHQNDDNQLQEVRSSSAAAVRVSLGLPPTVCTLNRP